MRSMAYLSLLLLSLAFLSCKKSSDSNTPATTTPIDTTVAAPGVFYKGADISWVSQMEASGYKFYDSTGAQTDCFQLMKNLGLNAIRLRVWVNPSDGWCDSADVMNKAKRAVALGMNVMLDFHYSDSWADPSKQPKPAAWASMSTNELIDEVYNYTYSVLSYMKSNGVTPTWVQVGNEVGNGMLWPDGQASTNMSNFGQMEAAGYAAVKKVDTSIKVIVHVNNGFDNSLFRWLFAGLAANGGKWDIIGMSLYPTTTNYATLDSECLANMNDMVNLYGGKVMICEAGMEEDQPIIVKAF